MAWRDYIFNKFQATIPSLVTGQSWPQVIDTTGALSINTEGRKATYSLDLQGLTPLAGFFPFFVLSGSNTKIIRVVKIRFAVTAATGANTFIDLSKTVTPLTGGTSVSLLASIASLDSLNPAATAVPTSYSVLPTGGGTGFGLASEQYEIVTQSVSVLPQIVEWKFGDVAGAQCLTLRGAKEAVTITMPGIGTTPKCGGFIEWTEE